MCPRIPWFRVEQCPGRKGGQSWHCMYLTVMDNRAIENIRDLELHFGTTKPAQTVETHGDWVIAWRITFKATHFIFPHRETKLKEYNNSITSYFTSIHPSTHLKILNIDRAIRNMLAQSTTYPLMTEINSVTSKHVISEGTALARAAPPPMRRQSRKITQPRERWTHATYEMKEGVVIRHFLMKIMFWQFTS